MAGQIDSLYSVQKRDLPRAWATLKDAFQHDPLWKAMVEQSPGRERRLDVVYEIPVRHCLKFGEVYATSVNCEGIAAWVPGKFADITLWRLLRSNALMPGLKIGPDLAMKAKPVMALLDKGRHAIMRGRAYLYLHIMGVATAYQGQGHGGKLLRALIERSEDQGLPVYLETQTERNVAMYKRFGFEPVKEITVPVVHLPMWEMVREPGCSVQPHRQAGTAKISWSQDTNSH